MKKRILSLFLVLSMLLSLFPTALAEESGVTEIAVHETVEDEAAVEMGIPALLDIVPEASNDFPEQPNAEIIEPGTEDSGNTINSVVPEEMEANADESVPSEQDEEIEQSENSMEGESTEPSSLEQWETAESDEFLTIPSSQESQDTFIRDNGAQTSQKENVETAGEDANDRESENPIGADMELDALSVEGTTGISENDSSGNTDHIIESEESCDAEFVRVVFICDPEDTQITVYDPTKPDENDAPTVIAPEESDTHCYLLLPGTYLYDAVCEGHEPVEKVEFEVNSVPCSEDTVNIRLGKLNEIVLTAKTEGIPTIISFEEERIIALPRLDSNTAFTYEYVTQVVETYMKAIDINRTGGIFWNADLSSNEVKQYTDSGQLLKTITPAACPGERSEHYHNGGKGPCTGNYWTGVSVSGGSQCEGFACYMEYVIFGDIALDSAYLETNPVGKDYIYPDDKFTKITSLAPDFEFHPGDLIRYDNHHAVVVYKIDGDNLIYIDCNSTVNCQIKSKSVSIETMKSRKLEIFRPPIKTELSESTFIMSFDSNGGTGYMSSFTVEYGNAFTLPANTFTKTGYEFKGWNVQRDVDGAYYVRSENAWMTQSQVDKGGYSKEVYPDQATKTFNDSWTDCVEGKSSYTFIAIWKEGAEKPASTLTISGEVYPSGHYDTMNSFGLRGKIASNYTITEVEAHVYDSSGKDALPAYNKAWNKTIYNIQSDGINNTFSFGNLDNGEYRYVVIAADESGERRKLIESDFSIGETIPFHEHSRDEQNREKTKNK